MAAVNYTRICGRRMATMRARAGEVRKMKYTVEQLGAVIEELEKRMREHHKLRGWRPRKNDRPRCTAITTSGKQCKARCVWDRLTQAPLDGRCRLHGALAAAQGRKQSGGA